MILPTKRITQNRSLLGIGGHILQILDEPKTISKLWDEFKLKNNNYESKNIVNSTPKYFSISYDWFILALDFLYCIEAVDLVNGKLKKLEKKDDLQNF